MGVIGRVALGIGAFVFLTVLIWVLGVLVYSLADIAPVIGSPSVDPHGRGKEGAVDFLGVGPFIVVFLGAIGACLVVLATFEENRTWEFYLTSLGFLIFSAVTAANYTRFDAIFTRDSQAILNIFLVGTAISVIAMFQVHLSKVKILALNIIAMFILFLMAYAFVALPGWYTISYLSWRLGAGELESLDSAAKAVGGMGSILGILGLQWKSGVLQRQRLTS